jgi:ribose transport system permease protein
LFGFIVGLIFILVRIPAMVLGIGMGLILETVAYLSSGGLGLDLFGKPGIAVLSQIDFTIMIVFLVALFTLILVSYTQYGYHLKAIQGSQRIAQNSGIKVFSHAVKSYAFAGAFVGISGILDSAYRTQMEASLGFTSNGPIFGGIFPMSLGIYIGKWSNPAIGIVTSTLTLKILSIGIGRLQLSDAMTNVVNMILFVLFLVYLANQNYFSQKRKKHQRIQMALQKRKELALAN